MALISAHRVLAADKCSQGTGQTVAPEVACGDPEPACSRSRPAQNRAERRKPGKAHGIRFPRRSLPPGSFHRLSNGGNRRHEACYDLIASEARIATFLAIARGDLNQQSWQKLGRDHTRAYGRFLLLSWSGTMFEYLMPALWMRSYPGTLIARTQDAVCNVQQAYGDSLGFPGASRNRRLRGRTTVVITITLPMAFLRVALARCGGRPRYLSLFHVPRARCRSARHWETCGAWNRRVGGAPTDSRGGQLQCLVARNPALAREWMAHHLGMSLLAITNLCNNNCAAMVPCPPHDPGHRDAAAGTAGECCSIEGEFEGSDTYPQRFEGRSG